ncbi:hypothetical protein BDN72DRAFT_842498 [Pluteus cervinus]|uniref:Uncharacterized protein n=1 Tax=Pluteus cervinus TaxID=181527 RepID=A0ACD3AQI6_9AGAR|nr:hypothetical protein BDN72DRAFT_842498 [Pluteus cervinus]
MLPFLNILRPVFLVLPLLAAYMMYSNATKSGLDTMITQHCPPTLVSQEETPFRLPYTGLFLDGTLCGIVTVFQTGLNSDITLKFLSYFLASGLPLLVFQVVEADRPRQNALIASPMIFALAGQCVTFAVVQPLYWFLFLHSSSSLRATGLHPANMHVTQAQAEAILFAISIGAIVPTVCLILMNDPQVTAIWQIFPVFISLSYSLHHYFRPSTLHPQSGYKTIQAVYIISFILASSTHIAIIWPMINDIQSFVLTFVPSVNPLPKSMPLDSLVRQLLQWDFVFTFIPAHIGSLWFAATYWELLLLVTWNILALPIIGPGATISAILLWRESQIQQHYDGGKIHRD